MIDIFAESCRFWEDDNPTQRVIIIDKDLIDRLEKWCEDNNCDIEIQTFIERNLEALGY
ncbi:MAG TPA: hypothetical protein VGB37_15530 [Candidatus Lokiarchaeia archaeon]